MDSERPGEEYDYELSAVFNAVRNDSERSAVMVAAAHLSELLRRLILERLIENSGAKNLFAGPTAPLGSFSSRASAAFALGLITHAEHRHITLIRRIRNAFAHEARASFRDEGVVSKCFQFEGSPAMPPTDGRNRSVMLRQEAGRKEFAVQANLLILLFTMRLKSGCIKRLTASTLEQESERPQ